MPKVPPPSTGSSSDYVNNDHDSPMHYPPASNLIINTPPSQGEKWSLPKEMDDRTDLLKIKDPQWPLRQAFGKDKDQDSILTNHFTYTLTVEKLYEYKILGLPEENVNRRAKKRHFETALKAFLFLEPVRDFFATDGIDTIISWRPIHEEFASEFTSAEGNEGLGQRHTRRMVSIGHEELDLSFVFIKEINVEDLRNYSLAHPDYEKVNFVDISRCLNMLVSQSLTADVYKQSTNKFFVKTARKRLSTSVSLETIRGYFYNVKPGTGNIIVNFNLATSAFFRPILVSEFLDDRGTFAPNVAESVLKRLRVYVEYDRTYDDADTAERLNNPSSRLWSVCGLSDRPIGELKFREKQRDSDGKPVRDEQGKYIFSGPEIKVVDYLQTG